MQGVAESQTVTLTLNRVAEPQWSWSRSCQQPARTSDDPRMHCWGTRCSTKKV